MAHHLYTIYQALLFVETLPAIHSDMLLERSVKFQWKTEHRKLVIFDLDETLVHCSDNSNA
jgi:hypothetical protein